MSVKYYMSGVAWKWFWVFIWLQALTSTWLRGSQAPLYIVVEVVCFHVSVTVQWTSFAESACAWHCHSNLFSTCRPASLTDKKTNSYCLHSLNQAETWELQNNEVLSCSVWKEPLSSMHDKKFLIHQKQRVTMLQHVAPNVQQFLHKSHYCMVWRVKYYSHMLAIILFWSAAV